MVIPALKFIFIFTNQSLPACRFSFFVSSQEHFPWLLHFGAHLCIPSSILTYDYDEYAPIVRNSVRFYGYDFFPPILLEHIYTFHILLLFTSPRHQTHSLTNSHLNIQPEVQVSLHRYLSFLGTCKFMKGNNEEKKFTNCRVSCVFPSSSNENPLLPRVISSYFHAAK